MNYLAHLYLSGHDEQILVGNFAGDYVKGRQWEKYPANIGKGILIHRDIDSFTDKHALNKEARSFFKPELRLYSGIVADLIYDHFLAKNWSAYSDIDLRQFSRQAHFALIRNFFHLPREVQRFLPFLIKNRRLESYATTEGIIEAMRIMSNYSSLPDKTEFVKSALKKNYETLERNFARFMPELIFYIEDKYGLKFRPDNQNFS